MQPRPPQGTAQPMNLQSASPPTATPQVFTHPNPLFNLTSSVAINCHEYIEEGSPKGGSQMSQVQDQGDFSQASHFAKGSQDFDMEDLGDDEGTFDLHSVPSGCKPNSSSMYFPESPKLLPPSFEKSI